MKSRIPMRLRKPFIILSVILLLGAIFLYFTKGTKAVGWWPQGSNYKYRKQLTVTNNSAAALSSGTTIAISVNTKGLYDTGKLKSTSCADLRITYQPSAGSATELTRFVSIPTGLTCATSTATKVYFKIQAALAAGSNANAYYMYHGNSTASAPSSTDDAFDVGSANALLVCPFDGTTTCAAGETPSSELGAIRYTGSKGAMSFDGKDDNISIGASAGILAAKEPFTIEAWVNRRGFSVGAYNAIVYFGDALGIRMNGGTGRVEFPLSGTSGVTSTGSIAQNTWTHVAAVYDGNNKYLFINGVLDGSTTGSSVAISSVGGAVGSDYISGISSLPHRVWKGYIDEVRLSSVARYTSNFTPQTTPFVRDTQTKILLHLDENGADARNATRAFDDSGRGWHGLIQNSPGYVAGFVGTDNGTSDTGTQSRQSYAAHEGVFLEQGTTNKITDPSFENAAYNTVWGTAGANITGGLTSSAPFYKFGTQAFRGIGVSAAISGTSNMETISINPGSTASHTLSFFAYDDTSTNPGGTITSNIVKPVWEGTAQSSGTYTDMGGGWWRVSYTTATTNSSNQYGFEIQPNRLVYVDGVQLEAAGQFGEPSVATTYTDGSLGVGYSWSGTAHNATTSRTAYTLKYSPTSNINQTQGTIAGWFKFPTGTKSSNGKRLVGWGSGCGSQYNIAASQSGANYSFTFVTDTTLTSSNVALGSDTWAHIVATYNASGRTLYVNGTSVGTDGNGNGLGVAPTELFLGDTSCWGTKSVNTVYSDLRIFDDDLSSTEVTDLYQAGLVGHTQGVQVDQNGGFDTKGDNATSIWHMDEGNGSTVLDSTIQANNLIMGTGSSAPSWTVATTGNSNARNTSLKFDGSNDYAARIADPDFDFGNDSFSLSGWFRHPSAVSGSDTILARYRTKGYKVYMNSSGYMCFDIDDDTTWTPDDSSCTTTSYADSKWHHFTAVKTGTTSITIYVDGRSGTTDSSIAATGSLDDNAALYVGIDSDGVNNPWDGFIDDIYVYPYARSATQIKADYTTGAQQTSGVLGADTTDPLSNGLIGYWKMDESTVGDLTDSSGNGYTATAVGTSVTGGKFGVSRQFNGSSDYTTSTVSSIPTTSGTKTTASFWVYWTGTDAQMPLHFGGSNLNLFFYSGYFGINTFNSDVWGIASTGFSNTWKHVTVVFYNGSVRSSEFYVDGVLQTSAQRTGTTDTTKVAGTTVHFGSYGAANFFGGKLDEMRIYDRALSAGEVAQLANFAPGPVGYWKFDDRSGPIAVDSGSSSMNGTLTSNPQWTSGKYGSALQYNKTPYVSVGDISNTSWSALSIGGWINWDGTTDTGYEGVWTKTAITEDVGRLLVKSDGQVLVQNGNGNFFSTAAGDIAANTWVHVQYVYDQSAGYEYIYINGKQRGIQTRSGNINQNSGTFIIGYGQAGTYRWSGKIDEVKIYNYARTQKQIVEDMLGSRSLLTTGGSNAGETGSMSGAVGHWKFDEGQGTTANNAGIGASGPNRISLGSMASPATATSGWTNSGKFGKALAFDGTNDYASTQIDLSGTNAITLSFWMKWTTFANDDKLALEFSSDYNGQTTGFLIDPNYSGNAKFSVGIKGSGGYNNSEFSRPSSGVWHHYAFVMDKSAPAATEVVPYVNGAPVAYSKAFSAENSNNYGNNMLYFMSRAGASLFGAGYMDEMKIYNYALTPAEIKTDYNRGQSLVLGSMSDNSSYEKNAANQEYCVPGDSTSCAAPVGEWKFDERSGSSANDTSGNGNTGTLTNGPVWSTGKKGVAVNLDGTNDYVNVTDSSSLDIVGNLTLSAWVKTSNTSGARAIFGKWKSNQYSYWLGFVGNNIRMYVGGDGTTNSVYRGVTTSGANDGNWHHVVATYSTTQVIKIYIDGTEKTLDTSNGTIPTSLYSGTADLQVGHDEINGDAASFFGYIDDAKVYNYARSAALVAWDYNRGAPVAHYKLDECSGGTANDASGNSNSGTITIGASGTQTSNGTCGSGTSTEAWSNGASGKFNSSMNFDGTDDYMQIADNDKFSFGNSTSDSPFSFSSWIKPTSLGGASDGNWIINKRDNSTNNEWQLVFWQGNLCLNTFDSTSVNYLQFCTSTTYDTGQWLHIVGSYSGSGAASGLKIYVNGKLQVGTALSGGTYVAMENGTTDIQIGKASWNANYNFVGQIDDVRIYNYALTSSQVKNVYNGGNSVYYGPSSGLP